MDVKRFKTLEEFKVFVEENKISLRVILDNDLVVFTNNLDYDDKAYEEYEVNGLGHGYHDLLATYSYIFKESQVEWV